MYKIDSNQGRFITVVPDTRRETGEFAELVYQSVIRWKEILRKKSTIEAVKVLKHYKYQPCVEKRHSLLKSVIEVASVYLKNNDRIEAFMFVYFIAQSLTALIERDIRLEMKNKGVEKIKILPEQRPTGTPTREQICRIFENIFHYELYSGKKTLKTFSDNLLPNQLVVLDLLKIPKNKFYLN